MDWWKDWKSIFKKRARSSIKSRLERVRPRSMRLLSTNGRARLPATDDRGHQDQTRKTPEGFECLIADRIPGRRGCSPRLVRRIRGLSDKSLAGLPSPATIVSCAGNQQLPFILDYLSVVHQLPRQPAEFADGGGMVNSLVPVDPADRGLLVVDSGNGHFVIWTFASNPYSPLALPSDRQEVPRPWRVEPTIILLL